MASPTEFDARGSAPGHGSADAELAERLALAQRRIAAAAERAGRSPHAVTLVAVTKGFDVDAVLAARALGQADFGESKAQELRRKAREAGAGVRWHFVGRLQRNKVKDVVGTASLIHSVDRLELANAIAERARKSGRVQRVLVQVNAGDDPAKGGCAVDEALALVARVRALDGTACEGLMGIPPLDADPRPVFATLRELRDDVRARFPEVQHLSMGMSSDFEVAVEEGATIVRLGEALFGPRPSAA
ncbi:MAG TPA: YggS family pyridoxal phosphate-dependent enzyme [Egibacteraceae bacterium]|nr:YggS family pyridoxal phosphate-dependent enzyme [Egibacteraceae bacterium]